MKIEDVYQKLSLVHFFSAFHRLGTSYLSKKYASYDIGYGHHQFLLALLSEDGITQDELTKRVAVDKVTTARAVDKLKKAGYITVVQDEKDKRYHRVWLTDKAKNAKDDTMEISNEWEAILLNNLDENDKAELLRLCRKIISKD